jgi:hypothetical protein
MSVSRETVASSQNTRWMFFFREKGNEHARRIFLTLISKAVFVHYWQLATCNLQLATCNLQLITGN